MYMYTYDYNITKHNVLHIINNNMINAYMNVTMLTLLKADAHVLYMYVH